MKNKNDNVFENVDQQLDKTEEQLVEEYNKGIKQSGNALSARYFYKIRKFYNKYKLPNASGQIALEEFISVGLGALEKASKSYIKGDCSFSTFASRCIKNAINTEWKKNKKNYNVLSIDQVINQDENINIVDEVVSNDGSEFDELEEQKEIKEVIKKVESKLSKQEKEVLDLFFKGYNHREIGDKLGITQKAVEKTIYRIKKKGIEVYKEKK